MKNKILILLTLFLMIFIQSEVTAQSAWTTGKNASVSKMNSGDGGYVVTFQGTLTAATDTLTSTVFSLTEYDQENLTTYPYIYGALLNGTSTATRKVSCQVLGSFNDSDYFVVDTIQASDSINTIIKKTFDINNYKVPYLKLIFFGTSGNSGTGFKAWIYAYRKDLYP
jgi:hypothetical protein